MLTWWLEVAIPFFMESPNMGDLPTGFWINFPLNRRQLTKKGSKLPTRNSHQLRFLDLSINTGWWFGTFFIFPYIGNVIIPTDFHIFQRGWNPPTRTSLAWGMFRLQFSSWALDRIAGSGLFNSQIFHCPSKINTMVSQISSETPKFQVSIPQTSTQPWESVKKMPWWTSQVLQNPDLVPRWNAWSRSTCCCQTVKASVWIISGRHGQKQNLTTFEKTQKSFLTEKWDQQTWKVCAFSKPRCVNIPVFGLVTTNRVNFT